MKLKIADLSKRTEFFKTNLASLGRPLPDALMPNLQEVKLHGVSLYPDYKNDPSVNPYDSDFSVGRDWAQGCLGWIWCQWLANAPAIVIRTEVERFVERGMVLQQKLTEQNYRCLHDLWLLHCAICASGEQQLQRLATNVVDADTSGQTWSNNGERYAAAWCGTLKYSILGDKQKAEKEFDTIWDTYKNDMAPSAPKSLASKWLTEDWKGFRKAQGKDFENRWERARKYRWIVDDNPEEPTVRLWDILPGRNWCWSHVGLAMLAHRRGIEVATDPLWFPAHALTCVEQQIPR